MNLIHDKLEQAVPKTEKKSEPWYIEWQKAIADFFRIFSACDKELENRKSQVRLSAKSLQSLGDAALVSSGKAVEISREESMAKQYQDAIKLETERLIEAGFKDFTTGKYDPYVILSEALDQKVTANTDITALWKQIKPIVAGSNEELLGEVDVMIGAMEVMGAEIQRKNGEVQMDKVHGAKAQALAGPERRQRIQSAFKMLNEGQLKRSYDKLHESQVKLDKIERSSSHDEDSPSFRI